VASPQEVMFARKTLMSAIANNMQEIEGMTSSGKIDSYGKSRERGFDLGDVDGLSASFPPTTNQWRPNAPRAQRSAGPPQLILSLIQSRSIRRKMSRRTGWCLKRLKGPQNLGRLDRFHENFDQARFGRRHVTKRRRLKGQAMQSHRHSADAFFDQFPERIWRQRGCRHAGIEETANAGRSIAQGTRGTWGTGRVE
jgi:hypothetical protein